MPKGDALGAGRETIFPGKDALASERLDFSADGSELVSLNGYFYPFVAGCLTYKSSLDPKTWHYSAFIAEIERIDALGRGVPMVDGSSIPAKQIRLNSVFYPQKAN